MDAPPPRAEGAAPAADTLILLPPSHVSAPVFFDLRPVLADIEAGLPRRIGSLEERRKLEGTPLLVAVELERRPLRFSFGENTVEVEAVFGYRGRAWLDSPVKPSVSCGTEGEPPRLRIRVATEYGMDSTWRIRTRSRLVDLAPLTDTPRDRCEVSLLSIDVTDKLVAGARGAIERELRQVDRQLGRVDLEDRATWLWGLLQEPLRITDSTVWLRIDPMAVGLGPIIPRDSGVVARISLVARPTFVTGPRPEDGATPLPPLGRPTAAGDSALVLVEGLLTWAGANEILGKELRGRRARLGWRWITLDEVAASPVGDGRVALEVRFTGYARGRVWLAGHPVYDPVSRTIALPDLELDARSRNVLTGGLLRLADGPLTSWARERARIPVDTLLAAARRKANEALDLRLATGVRLTGEVLSAEPIGVVTTAEGLVARARGVARLRLDIRQENLIPPIRMGRR